MFGVFVIFFDWLSLLVFWGFLINFRHLLRLAVLSCFAAQLAKGRKAVQSSVGFDLFLLLCSSFKLSSRDLVSKICLF